MEVTETGIEGLLVIKPKVFGDERGYFFESYHVQSFQKIGIEADFMQDNESLSAKGVLRGLHFQQPPFAQGKLVRVITGKVLDVAVDIRKNSPTYGEHYMVELSADNKLLFWIPPGFAHGFIALEDHTIFSYKCTNVYSKESEGCIVWNDPDLAINWGYAEPLVSAKDKEGAGFKEFISPF